MSRFGKPSKSGLLFIILLLPLLAFNVRAITNRQAAQASIDNRSLKASLIDEMKSLHGRHVDAIVANSREEATIAGLLNRSDLQSEKPCPILEHDFLVQKHSTLTSPNKKQVRVFVPKQGQHKLKIQIWLKKESLVDQTFSVQAGHFYNIQFALEDDQIRTEFPGHDAIETALPDFELQHLDVDRSSDAIFVSPNQPAWRKGLAFFDPPTSGVLCEFRYDSRDFDSMSNLHEAVSVRVSALSDGPMTVAADDRLTVLRLDEMARGQRERLPFRYEAGRYIFE